MRYKEVYDEILKILKRTYSEENKLLADPNVDFRKKLVITLERGYKNIAHEQIKLADIVISLLKGILEKKYQNISEAYRNYKAKSEKNDNYEFTLNRIKIKKYLRSFSYGSKIM